MGFNVAHVIRTVRPAPRDGASPTVGVAPEFLARGGPRGMRTSNSRAPAHGRPESGRRGEWQSFCGPGVQL